MKAFENYLAFETVDSARSALGNLLADLEIPYHISTVNTDTDLMFAKSTSPMSIWLQLYPEDFDKVTKLLDKSAYDTVVLNKQHFLNSYSDTELRDVIYRSDEWNAEDYAMARKILESRSILYSDAELLSLRGKRLADIRKPKSGGLTLIGGFVVLPLGGVLSVMIGWGLYSSTRTDPTGRKYFEYDAPSRQKGLAMLIMGILIFFFYAAKLVMMK